MNEQETIIVSAAKEEYQDNPNSCVGELLIIIDCLDAENEKLKADLDKVVDALVKS